MRWRTEKARPRRVSGLPAMRLQPSARGGWHTEGEGTAPASQVISQHLSALHSAGATFAGALGGSSNEISACTRAVRAPCARLESSRDVWSACRCVAVACRASRSRSVRSRVRFTFIRFFTLHGPTQLTGACALRPCVYTHYAGRHSGVCNVCGGVCSVYECQRDLSGRVCTMQTTNSLDLQ